MARDIYVIPLADRRWLREKLDTELPPLVEELAITELRLDRTIRNDRVGRRSADSSREIFDDHARDISIDLNKELRKWVALVRKQGPRTPAPKDDSTLSLGRWLSQNIAQVALTEGTERAPADIHGAMKRAWRAVDLPAEDEIAADRSRVEDARSQVLSAGQIAVIAHHFGDQGAGLTRHRVYTLERNEQIEPVHTDSAGTHFFVVGTVLDAHISYPRRPPRKPKPPAKTKRRRKPKAK